MRFFYSNSFFNVNVQCFNFSSIFHLNIFHRKTRKNNKNDGSTVGERHRLGRRPLTMRELGP